MVLPALYADLCITQQFLDPNQLYHFLVVFCSHYLADGVCQHAVGYLLALLPHLNHQNSKDWTGENSRCYTIKPHTACERCYTR